MKVTVDVDCTPEEARRFLGLPDLSAVHEAYVEKMKAAVADVPGPEAFSDMMKAWGPMSESQPRHVAADARPDDEGSALIDTIFALSSGAPPAAVGVVRISGPKADAVVQALAGRLARAAHGASGHPASPGRDSRQGARPPLSGTAQRDRRGCRRASPSWRPIGGRGDPRGAGRHRRPARGGAGRIHPPRLRAWPHRPQRSGRPGRPAHGRDPVAAAGGACAGRRRAQPPGRSLAGLLARAGGGARGLARFFG